jgi:hypothetical protein
MRLIEGIKQLDKSDFFGGPVYGTDGPMDGEGKETFTDAFNDLDDEEKNLLRSLKANMEEVMALRINVKTHKIEPIDNTPISKAAAVGAMKYWNETGIIPGSRARSRLILYLINELINQGYTAVNNGKIDIFNCHRLATKLVEQQDKAWADCPCQYSILCAYSSFTYVMESAKEDAEDDLASTIMDRIFKSDADVSKSKMGKVMAVAATGMYTSKQIDAMEDMFGDNIYDLLADDDVHNTLTDNLKLACQRRHRMGNKPSN